MTIQSAAFEPRHSSLQALLNQIYDIKFSKHTTLVVVLLSMLYTVYRTQHYLGTAFKLDTFVRWPTSIFIELLVLAAGAAMFGALRTAYIAQLKAVDADRAKVGVWTAGAALSVAFVALLFVAFSDAWLLTKEVIPTLIMAMVQVTQMLFIVGFISAADQDERAKLREQFQEYQQATATTIANSCPHCFKPVSPNNRARHIDSCPMRPKEMTT
jgi:signal transduction histidine kinase